MTKTSKKILDKIEKEHIKPTPKWQFVLMHTALWVLFAASIIFGSIAVSVALFKIVASDWTVVPRLPGGPMIVLPYIWILILGIMAVIGSILFEKTDKGYKHHLWTIGIASVGLSIVLGSILFAVRFGEGVENGLRENFKPYREYQELREEVFHAPESGVLPGRIVELQDDVMIMMDDFSGVRWKVDITDAKMPVREIQEGTIVIAVGEKTSKDEFKADWIRPGNVMKDRLGKPPKNGMGAKPLTR
ncbi:hypothetical protein ACFL3T_03935 [Patescibacteria group bacterium]